MLFPCLFHAIFTRFVLKKLLFISISNKVKENSKKSVGFALEYYIIVVEINEFQHYFNAILSHCFSIH